MKIAGFIIVFSLFTISGCKQSIECDKRYNQILRYFSEGNFTQLKVRSDSLLELCTEEKQILNKADSLLQIAERIKIDFSVAEDKVIMQIKGRMGDFTSEDKSLWENRNWLEYRMIDGEKRYFNRAASNLNLLNSFHNNRAQRDSLEAGDPEIKYRKSHTQLIINASEKQDGPVMPVDLTIYFTLTIDPDAVPPDKTVRCWLPFPKEGYSRQQKVTLLSSSHGNYIIAPDSSVHRTIYMEATAKKGEPLVFSASFYCRSSGQYFNPDRMIIIPYDKSSELYRKYTAEQPPHICFTERIKNLADSITGNEERPFETARRIYLWFSENIPWTGALEYSIIPNIPEYVLKNRRGDCGMQTFLLMSMLRYKGIPVRWQSGWKVPPGAKNLHDWCEIYFEGTGWVPVDISYGLQYSNNQKTREFYISGIDSYRLIVNDGISGRLYPEKRFMRSEPFDFQRGEVEWDEENLYFDKWDYEMKIEYSK